MIYLSTTRPSSRTTRSMRDGCTSRSGSDEHEGKKMISAIIDNFMTGSLFVLLITALDVMTIKLRSVR